MVAEVKQWLVEHGTLVRTLIRASNETGKGGNVQAARNLQLAKDVLMAHAQAHPGVSAASAGKHKPTPPGQAPLLSIDDDDGLINIAKMAGFTDAELAARSPEEKSRWNRVMRQFVRLARTPSIEASGDDASGTDAGTDEGTEAELASHREQVQSRIAQPEPAPQWISNLSEQAGRMEQMAEAMEFSDSNRAEVLASACVLNEAHVSALKLLAREQKNLQLTNQLHERLDSSKRTIKNLNAYIAQRNNHFRAAFEHTSASPAQAATGTTAGNKLGSMAVTKTLKGLMR